MDIKKILRETLQKRGVRVPALAEQIGIPKDRIYAWYRDNTQPKAEDRKILEKWIIGETSVFPVEHEKEPEVTQDRYVKLLEDNDKFFKTLIKANLGTAEVVQASILAHLKAMVQADAEEKSGGDKKKREKIVNAWNKRIAENLGVLERKDSYSAVDS